MKRKLYTYCISFRGPGAYDLGCIKAHTAREAWKIGKKKFKKDMKGLKKFNFLIENQDR